MWSSSQQTILQSSSKQVRRTAQLLPLLIWLCACVCDARGNSGCPHYQQANTWGMRCMLMPRPDSHPYYHQQGVVAVTLRGDWMSADGADWRLALEGYGTPQRSLMMRGWVPSDWCSVSAARLNQYHLMRCPTALRCASTQSMFYLSFPSLCVSKLIG